MSEKVRIIMEEKAAIDAKYRADIVEILSQITSGDIRISEGFRRQDRLFAEYYESIRPLRQRYVTDGILA